MPAAFVVAVNVDPLNVNVTVLPATGVEPALSVADNVIGVPPDGPGRSGVGELRGEADRDRRGSRRRRVRRVAGEGDPDRERAGGRRSLRLDAGDPDRFVVAFNVAR